MLSLILRLIDLTAKDGGAILAQYLLHGLTASRRKHNLRIAPSSFLPHSYRFINIKDSCDIEKARVYFATPSRLVTTIVSRCLEKGSFTPLTISKVKT